MEYVYSCLIFIKNKFSYKSEAIMISFINLSVRKPT